jgi:hypothetical protein
MEMAIKTASLPHLKEQKNIYEISFTIPFYLSMFLYFA